MRWQALLPMPRAPDIAAWLRGVAGLLIWSFIPFPVSRGLLPRLLSAIIDERFTVAGGGGMMARMLTQVPLPLLPRDAAEIAPGVGVVAGPDGSGVVWVHGLATFAWDAGDEAARRLAAVQLVQLKAATQVQVAQAFGVIPVSVWRWAKALAGGGVAGLVPAVKGPQRASKLTPQVIGRIRELDRQGAGKAAIAAAAGVSESSVRSVLRPARPAAGERPRRPGPRGHGQRGHRTRASRSRSRRCCRCCRIRCPGTGSGRWPGSGCWARAPRRRSRRARATRWPGCCSRCRRWRAPGCWTAPGRYTGGCGTGSTAWR